VWRHAVSWARRIESSPIALERVHVCDGHAPEKRTGQSKPDDRGEGQKSQGRQSGATHSPARVLAVAPFAANTPRPNFVPADLECDVGLFGSVSRVTIDPTVLVTVVTTIILTHLMHLQT
jgi:hypothetical protein